MSPRNFTQGGENTEIFPKNDKIISRPSPVSGRVLSSLLPYLSPAPGPFVDICVRVLFVFCEPPGYWQVLQRSSHSSWTLTDLDRISFFILSDIFLSGLQMIPLRRFSLFVIRSNPSLRRGLYFRLSFNLQQWDCSQGRGGWGGGGDSLFAVCVTANLRFGQNCFCQLGVPLANIR